MSEPVRVLRVIARMNVGGPALQVTALQRHLDPSRFDSRLVIGDLDPGEGDYIALRAPDVAAQRVEGLGRTIRPGDDLRALVHLVRLMRRLQPHIVHTHTAKAGTLGRVAARIARVPFVVHTFHGHLLHGYFGPRTTKAVIAVERVLARKTDRLVAVGAQVRDDLVGAGIGSMAKYVVVPPGVVMPRPRDRGAARQALGLPADGVVVAFAGRLTKIKRPERAVEALRELRSRHPHVTLAIAGEGEELEAVRAAAAPLGDAVRILGWVADVNELYAASDIVLLTSDNEGMPVSLIEAAAAGRPAVATRVGSVAEVVLHGETGIVVDDPSELTSAIETLILDPALRARMGAAARRHAEQQFSEQRLVQDITRLYDELLVDGFGMTDRR